MLIGGKSQLNSNPLPGLRDSEDLLLLRRLPLLGVRPLAVLRHQQLREEHLSAEEFVCLFVLIQHHQAFAFMGIPRAGDEQPPLLYPYLKQGV